MTPSVMAGGGVRAERPRTVHQGPIVSPGCIRAQAKSPVARMPRGEWWSGRRYSARSARLGSTPAAFRAGSQEATAATVTSAAATAP